MAGLTLPRRVRMFRGIASPVAPIMIFKSLCRHAGIGANSYLLETRAARVVLDAGMHPEHEGMEAVPHYEFLEDDSVDSIVITHSHLDHVGTLPVFLENQSQAQVFLTPETGELGELHPIGDAGVAGAGVLRIKPLDFAKQMTTFRTTGPGGAAAVAAFGQLFLGQLWDTYAGLASREG